MASLVHVMEKPIQIHHQQHPQQQQNQQQRQQQQQQQQKSHEALKCPRCDSSNTKFCYYNNYSLSQPRHFCKACKRYWTRGGTLRNVPVGGGCRKNKRVKRPITTTSTHVAATSAPVVNRQTNPNPTSTGNTSAVNLIPTSNGDTSNNHHFNPLLYGLLPQNPNFPRFDHARVSNPLSGYDLLQNHMNGSGLAFSCSGRDGSIMANHGHNPNLTFSSYMNSNSSIYPGGGLSSSSTSTPTMASLLSSSVNNQQRFMGFEGITAYDGGSMVKDLKMEDTQNMMEWNTNNFHDPNKNDDRIEAVVSSDPNSILWDGEGGSGWLDPSNNIGSSVPSLI